MLRVLHVELLPVEEVPLYTICPGCLALRAIVPGGGFPCAECLWSEYNDVDVELTKPLTVDVLRDKLAITRAEVVVVDGPDPLASMGVDAVCSVLDGVEAVRVVKTLGLSVEPRVDCVDALVVDLSGLVASEKPRGFTRVYDTLARLAGSVHVELLFPYVRRGLKSVLVDIVSRYDMPVTVVPLEELFEEAYRVVDALRKEGRPVYLHGDTSYTLLDVFCTSCRTVLVERRPWGVKRRYEPPVRPSRVRCPSCGSLQPLLDARPVKRPKLRRRVVVY